MKAAACCTWRSARGGIRAPTIMATTSATLTFTGDTADEWRVK